MVHVFNKQNNRSSERVQAAINQDRWLTVQELEYLGIPRTCVLDIFRKGLAMRHVAAQYSCRGCCRKSKKNSVLKFVDTATNDPEFLTKFITRNESRVYGLKPGKKNQCGRKV